ncbi:MAG: arginine repressor [Treponema sp.]|nr:arginine repressor [Treponema sp.]
MKGKDERLSTIRQLIRSNTIQNQDELLELLQKEGFEVTQATLSRDLRYLQVVKIPGDNGTYIYSFSTDSSVQETSQIYIQDFLRGYLSVETSGNMVVIKTFQGHANTVCNAIDNLEISEILGTVAGDNTMFAVLREGVTKSDFEKALKAKIPGVEIN